MTPADPSAHSDDVAAWLSHRLILSLLHLEGKPLEEIARLTGLSRVVVKVRAFRARKKLHAALLRMEGNGEKAQP